MTPPGLADGPPAVDIAALVAWEEEEAARPDTAPTPPSPAARLAAQQLDAALQSHGLLRLANVCLVPRGGSAVELLRAARAFFALPTAAKAACAAPRGRPGFVRGYLRVGAESGLPELFEPKEGFSFGADWPPTTDSGSAAGGQDEETSTSAQGVAPPSHIESDTTDSALAAHVHVQSKGSARTPAAASQHTMPNPLQGPNVWPGEAAAAAGLDVVAWRDTLRALYARMVLVARAVVRGLALALGRTAEELLRFCDGGETISLVRLFFYHPAPPERRNCIGSSPHTDWGFLTLILQDAVGGLEYQQAGQWHAVPPTPEGRDELILNGGDALELMTRGRYRAPVHRVLCPQQQRVSFVFFFYPAYEARLDDTAWCAAGPGEEQQGAEQGKRGVAGGVDSDGSDGVVDGEEQGMAGVAGETVSGEARDGEESQRHSYNTLLRGVTMAADGGLPCFGDCIVQKWSGVDRAG